MSSAVDTVKNVVSPVKKAFDWVGEQVAPEIDTSGQEQAIRDQARQQARQSAESARQAAASQASASEREQILRQRSEETEDDDEGDADVRVGSDEYDTARKRRKQFTGGGQGDSQSPSIRI